MIRQARITDEVFQVGGGQLTSLQDAAVYLLLFGEEAALVDAGCGSDTDRLCANIRACSGRPVPVKYLLLTHCHFDHAGGAAELSERLQCPIVAHSLDAEHLERGDDAVTAAAWYGRSMKPVLVHRRIAGSEEKLTVGDRTVRAMHIPGHSPGSLVYLAQSCGKRVLFAQDVHGPLHSSLLSDERAYVRSLRSMLALDADILCEGHFGVFAGRNKVRDFITAFLPEEQH
jgi:glyoxylase-like metal-dependent hydrolase (beta-lactamase superfamily II)